MSSRDLILKVPERIGRLAELAHNLWWSWHPQARELFRTLDTGLWRATGHNPVEMMHRLSPERLHKLAADPEFVSRFDAVMAALDAELSGSGSWFLSSYPGLESPIAYFSSEFAVHSSLPIYAGGLGVLAGDTCKEASDLGVPFLGVGLMYSRGYFQQRVSADGWQEEVYQAVNWNDLPVTPVFLPEGKRALTTVRLDNRTVSVGAWRVDIGRTPVYLLHTDLEENAPEDRQLCDNLYVANQEVRLQQEIILGIGGVRILRALGIRPAIWHANEGHTAFMMLERIREKVVKGLPLDEAIRKTRSTTVFTTHTPVPAGHDMFPVHLLERYFLGYWQSVGLDPRSLLELGSRDGSFNMTVLALSTSEQCNAVSQLNGSTSRRMWRVLWPELNEEEVPISHVTNGIHVPTWVSPAMGQLYDKYLGTDWLDRHDDPAYWERVKDIPDEVLWLVRLGLKQRLIQEVRDRCRRAWSQESTPPHQALAMGALLDPEVLTIGFVRRFAEYKRPALMFQDIGRLRRILENDSRPVQIIFAGKSHPNDFPAKCLLQQAYGAAKQHGFQGRIAFIENYDMHLAQLLVPGVDVWLNTPRRRREACGTSGIKASLNGVPHLSILDGWWHEGHNGGNGWAIGNGDEHADPASEDRQDAEALYQLLENEIVPLYYDRGSDGVPHGWLRVVKEAMRSVVPPFSARRMMKEYVERMYGTAVAHLMEARHA